MRIASIGLFAILVAACGGGTSGDDIGDDTSAPDAGGVGASCGGFAGLQCDDTLWCDYSDDSCGGADGLGSCQPRPTGCGDNYFPVCACDGTVYGNACDAQAAGFDVNVYGTCEPPAAHFQCGAVFCSDDVEYCRVIISDVGGYPNEYSCNAAPAGCGGTADCACLTGETCGGQCEATGTGFTLTCPGG